MSAAKRRRRGFGGIITVFVIMLLIMTIGGYYILTKQDRLAKSSKWVRQVDLTTEAQDNIKDWISLAIMGDEIDVKSLVPELKVNIVLTIDSKGNWSEAVDKASYEDCEAKASAALKEGFLTLLGKRLSAADMGTADEEALFKSALGMDVDTYFALHGPRLLPSLDEMLAQCNEGYSANYLCNSESLVISDGAEAVLYNRWEGRSDEE